MKLKHSFLSAKTEFHNTKGSVLSPREPSVAPQKDLYFIFWKVHFSRMAQLWFDGCFLYVPTSACFFFFGLPLHLNEQLQQKGGRMTELVVGTGMWRPFSLITHSVLHQASCGFV